VVDMVDMKHRKSQKQDKAYSEHLERQKEIERLKKEILEKKKEQADKTLEARRKKREQIIEQNRILLKEREERRQKMSRELEKKIKQLEKAQAKKQSRLKVVEARKLKKDLSKQKRQQLLNAKIQGFKNLIAAHDEKKRLRSLENLRAKQARAQASEEKKLHRQQVKQEKHEAIQLKVVNAKESVYKKLSKAKSSLSSIKNLKVSKTTSTIAVLLLLGISGYAFSKTNFIQDKIADYKNEQLLDDASTHNSEDTSIDISTDEASVLEEVEEVEEVVEEHETISTELYDSGYEFNEEITPDYLDNINPDFSTDTFWFTVPGTKIDIPIVHPNQYGIDEAGLRSEADKSGYSDYRFANEYFLHHNLTGDYTTAGTAYLDAFNNSLSSHSNELSDNSVIYAHNMRNNSQFGDLDKWTKDSDQSFNQEHPFGIIYTNDGYGYKVTWITSRVVAGEDNSVLQIGNFESYDAKNTYIQDIIAEAKEKGWFTLDEYEVKEDDKFISLISCNYSFDNARYQLIGVLEKIKIRDIDSIYDDGYYVEENSTYHR
jgi:hypothetical protein